MTGPVRPMALAALLALAASARAEPEPPKPPAPQPPKPEPPAPPPAQLRAPRALSGGGQFAQARAPLLEAYQAPPHHALLFALSQVELNLGHPREAIVYYEKFSATGPGEDELSLAQQALGAAQM